MKTLAKLVLRYILWGLRGRPYDKLVHENYMERWYIIPRNPYFNIYFHRFIGSDGPVPHDHPWWSVSFILQGWYIENTPTESKIKEAGSITYRPATGLHWIKIHDPVYTLFITGRKVRKWGFQCKDRWIPWDEYVELRGDDRLSNGCDE